MRLGDDFVLLERLPVRLGARDVVGPGLDDTGGPVRPVLDHQMELDEELAHEDEPREPLGKRTRAVEIRLRDANVGGEPFVAPFPHAGERGEQIRLAGVFGEEHFDQLLELEGRTVAGRGHPLREGPPPLAVIVYTVRRRLPTISDDTLTRTENTMTTNQQQLTADPSNAGMVGAWDGNEGAFWTAQADLFDGTLANCHGPFLAAAAIRDSDRVLDVGCGTGQATRDAARLAASGSAVGVDLSSQMLALARQTAAAEGVENIEFRYADAQIHPFVSGEFDIVMSRMGSMFFGDPVAAFTNLHRALRPGGRLVLLTWQSVADNEWLTEFRAALAVGRDLPTPPPDAPSPFALADPDRVLGILGAAGFADVTFQGLREPMSFGPDPDDAFQFVSELTSWMRNGLDEAGRESALAALRTTIADHADDRGVAYESGTWIIQARKPLTYGA